tara:strand:+ start:269 stop:508 length:240 start_codon:yes stop_codon:yes gene_type:complete
MTKKILFTLIIFNTILFANDSFESIKNNQIKLTPKHSARTAFLTSQKSTMTQVKKRHYIKSIINQSNAGPSKKSSRTWF